MSFDVKRAADLREQGFDWSIIAQLVERTRKPLSPQSVKNAVYAYKRKKGST